MQRTLQSLILSSAMALAGCGISGPVSVPGLTDVVGSDLAGAQGLTLEDQDKIDITMARLCAARAIPRQACDLHTPASAERRQMSPDS